MRPSFGFDPASIPPALANRVLEREAWAQSCLAAHAGSLVVVAVGPFTAAMRIDAAGKLEAAPVPADAPNNLRLTVSPLALPSFLADPRRWDELVRAEGDPALAATLKGLAETLPWFVERAFADVLGPIVGQRVADAGRHLLAFPEYAATRVGAAFANYVRDENRLVTPAADAQSFAETVGALASRTDALAARVDALAARLAARPAEERPV
jgi:ubiquinone biosynthesis protein UbiJ